MANPESHGWDPGIGRGFNLITSRNPSRSSFLKIPYLIRKMNQDIWHASVPDGTFSSSYYHPSDTVTPQHCCHKQQWGPKLPVINNVFVVNFCGTRFQSLGIQGNVLHFCSLHMVKCSTDLFYWINVWLMVKLIPKLLNVTQSNSNMEVVIHSVITEHTLCAKHSAKGLKVMKKYNTWF